MEPGKVILKEGVWGKKPYDATTCLIKLTTNSETKEKEKIIGDSDCTFDDLLDDCLRTMHLNEVCKFVQNNQHITVELLKFQHAGFINEWSNQTIFEYALQHKNRGVELFQKNNTSRAAFRFQKSLKLLCSIPLDVNEPKNLSDLTLEELNGLKAKCYNNLATCYLKHEEWDLLLQSARKVLDLEPENVKALYKLGLALENNCEFEQADQILCKLVQLEPANRAALAHQEKVKQELVKREQYMNEVVKKMFVNLK